MATTREIIGRAFGATEGKPTVQDRIGNRVGYPCVEERAGLLVGIVGAFLRFAYSTRAPALGALGGRHRR